MTIFFVFNVFKIQFSDLENAYSIKLSEKIGQNI